MPAGDSPTSDAGRTANSGKCLPTVAGGGGIRRVVAVSSREDPLYGDDGYPDGYLDCFGRCRCVDGRAGFHRPMCVLSGVSESAGLAYMYRWDVARPKHPAAVHDRETAAADSPRRPAAPPDSREQATVNAHAGAPNRSRRSQRASSEVPIVAGCHSLCVSEKSAALASTSTSTSDSKKKPKKDSTSSTGYKALIRRLFGSSKGGEPKQDAAKPEKRRK